MMNINEFERSKPIETYKLFDKLIKKYQEQAVSDVMDDADEVRRSMAVEMKADLLRLKQIFVSGE